MYSWRTSDRGFLKAKQLTNTGREGKETDEATPLNEVETVVEGLRFDEVDGESPAEVGGEEETEGGAFGVRVAIIAAKGEGEQGKKEPTFAADPRVLPQNTATRLPPILISPLRTEPTLSSTAETCRLTGQRMASGLDQS